MTPSVRCYRLGHVCGCVPVGEAEAHHTRITKTTRVHLGTPNKSKSWQEADSTETEASSAGRETSLPVSGRS